MSTLPPRHAVLRDLGIGVNHRRRRGWSDGRSLRHIVPSGNDRTPIARALVQVGALVLLLALVLLPALV